MGDVLDAGKVYYEYYHKNNDKLCQLLDYYLEKKKIIALWGAGRKGSALLQAIDPQKEKISYIYDKNEKRIGEKLETGHIVEDYRKCLADVVLVANSLFELEIIHKINPISPKTSVINIDNMLLGNLSVSDVTESPKYNSKEVRKNKICAVVVLYNPNNSVIKNIYSYSNELDGLYIYDNSMERNENIVEELKKIPNAEYIGKQENCGLSKVFNETAVLARNAGYTWMVTFDQDSIAEKGMVDVMREFSNSNLCDENIAVIAPTINDIDDNRMTQDRYYTYFDKVIQSGAMHNLEIMNAIGNFDENLFIDLVDYEYCTRCVVHGYKIVKLGNALLMHNQQDDFVEQIFVDGTEVFINKYTPDRYYYRYRNAKYCFDKYKESYPLYALDCQNTIMKLIPLQIKYDKNQKENEAAVKQAILDLNNRKYGRRM